MTEPGNVPTQENVRPPGLARRLVALSLRTKVREEGLSAFDDEFADRVVQTDDLKEARSWALRVAWECLQEAYKPAIDIGMYSLAVVGVVLAVVAIM